MRRLLFVLIFALAAVAVLPQAANGSRPAGITTGAVIGLVGTWIGLGVGFFGLVLTIKRDRSAAQKDLRAMQEAVDQRTKEVLHAQLNDSAYRDRNDKRIKEVVWDMAYKDFHYDPKSQHRFDLIEQDIRRLRDDIASLQRQVQEKQSLVAKKGG